VWGWFSKNCVFLWNQENWGQQAGLQKLLGFRLSSTLQLINNQTICTTWQPVFVSVHMCSNISIFKQFVLAWSCVVSICEQLKRTHSRNGNVWKKQRNNTVGRKETVTDKFLGIRNLWLFKPQKKQNTAEYCKLSVVKATSYCCSFWAAVLQAAVSEDFSLITIRYLSSAHHSAVDLYNGQERLINI